MGIHSRLVQHMCSGHQNSALKTRLTSECNTERCLRSQENNSRSYKYKVKRVNYTHEGSQKVSIKYNNTRISHETYFAFELFQYTLCRSADACQALTLTVTHTSHSKSIESSRYNNTFKQQ